jgi:ferritin
MIGAKMQEALNGQINAEMYSAYIYLSMSAFFESKDLPGLASWMKAQAQEEVVHSMKLYTHIIERGGRVTLGAIDAPQTEWDSPQAVFEAAYKHEQHVTKLIHDLVALAIKENDYPAKNMLDWFVDEQVEEEATASGIVAMMKMAGSEGPALLMLDRQLAARSFDAAAGE